VAGEAGQEVTMADAVTVVFGATGHVGGVIAERLLAAGRKVRVVARSADRLAALGKRGAEVVVGDASEPALARRATAGAGAAYVLLPPHFGPGFSAFQDRTIAALADALEANRVGHAVVLSSIGADLPSGNGPVAGLHRLEQRLDRIAGLNRLHLRPGYFFDNHLQAVGMVKGLGLYGSALRADLRMAQLDPRDIGEVAARRLLALDWRGREVLELQGQRDLTMAEVAAVLGKAIGKPDLRYQAFPYPDARAGMVQAGLTEELADLYVDMSRGFNEGRMKAQQPRAAATTTPTAIEAWAERVFAPAFRG
jgi:uncharacterized protein YbjT (DUF2867 family)